MSASSNNRYECEHCGSTKQWRCRCWETEAATYKSGWQAYCDALDQRRAEEERLGVETRR